MIISMSHDYDQEPAFEARGRNASFDYEQHRRARAKVWDRIKDIIEENNANNMDSRGVAYIGSGLKAKYQPCSPRGRVVASLQPRDMETRIQDPHSDLVYRVEMRREGMTGGGDAKRGRKKRSDAGKPRKDSDWIRLVKAVADYEDIPYNKALKVASQYKKDGYTYRDFE